MRTDNVFASSDAKPSSSSMRQKQHDHLHDDEYFPSASNQPFVTCKSYAIIDTKYGKVIHGKCVAEVREMASLTKMMTAICSIELA